MTSIQIILDGDDCWPDLEALPAGKLLQAELAAVALLPDGEVTDLTGQSKRVPIVVVRVTLPGGAIGLAQVKLEMWEAVSRALRARMGYLAEQRAAGKADA